ncbi:MAG TPA: proton-conducting transporter membrane subunit [bacterium]|nr:proton-conducting transporter membrane subunit [bacterium]HOL34616.1 proton-conducting transporter membrane subunit [bacterium]HPP08138.1 proton-conducting transporter membrane subunit [bacterium]
MDIMVYYFIGIPFIAGLFCLLLPDKWKTLMWAIAFDVCLVLFGYFVYFFDKIPALTGNLFVWDGLTNFTLLGVSFFGLIISLYSYNLTIDFLNRYYGFLLLTVASGIGVSVSNNLLLMAVFWGILAITLYMMINLGGSDAAYPAKKTFIMVGGSDSFLILGIAIVWVLTGVLNITEMHIEIDRALAACGFLSFVIAAFTKAGAMPFHSWIPEIAENAPVSVMAFLPASIDKLLGIYLLARVCLNMFSYHETMWFLLRLVGALTIVCAVFMALIQHNMKKLLAYHAVSQVGYMVLGIASANSVGVVGGLFHMLNHAIYKCCLFLGAGSVEEKTKTTDLDQLGGLAGMMPITFVSFLFASFAISGIPPFNGFFSKWMIYQGLVEAGKSGEPSWILWIVMALIGSGLTLASFMKIIHAVFLGQKSASIEKKDIKEVHWTMFVPATILSLLCLCFGLFYFQIPLSKFFLPIMRIDNMEYILNLELPLLLIIAGIILGFVIYPMFMPRKRRIAPVFIGGEKQEEEMRISGTEFYNVIRDTRFLKTMYVAAEKKITDLYEVLKSTVLYFTEGFRVIHTGILGTYLTWILFGTLVFLYIFIRW